MLALRGSRTCVSVILNSHQKLKKKNIYFKIGKSNFTTFSIKAIKGKYNKKYLVKILIPPKWDIIKGPSRGLKYQTLQFC